MAGSQDQVRCGTSACAIYTRQSNGIHTDLTSCQIQFEACDSFIRSQKGNGWYWIGERFDDEGWSSASLDRPALQHLLEKIRNGEVHKLVVYRLDRLSRNVIDSALLLNELRELKVDLVIVTAPQLGTTAQDSLILNLLSIFAEFERDLIAARIADARQALKRQGRRIGGALPIGYDADPYTKQLVINPQEQRQVCAMFEMAAEGFTPSQIVQVANAKRWRTKTRSGRSGKTTGGNPWTARQVLAMLSNPIYMGKIADAAQLRNGIHIPIVPEALFAQVHAHISSRRTRHPGRTERSSFWPLKRLIRCTQCGHIMSTHMTCHGSKIYRYYRCRSMPGGRIPCSGTQISAGKIEKKVAEILANLPESVRGPLITEETRGVFLRFSAAWSLLASPARQKALPQIIQEITYNPNSGRVTVNLNLEGLRQHDGRE